MRERAIVKERWWTTTARRSRVEVEVEVEVEVVVVVAGIRRSRVEVVVAGIRFGLAIVNTTDGERGLLLENATIPPVVNQVEKKCFSFVKRNIHICAWCPLGANGAVWGSHRVMQSPILKEIAQAKTRVEHRWL
ncbi:putative aldo-keto reductase [Abeliophyllum distichum]|uniref:Aldo-keto reductase n=1 Tax=Abeliophyllum distichum TaxID=126358 RepID=A0ABD1PPU4_9LAMI